MGICGYSELELIGLSRNAGGGKKDQN